MTTEYTITESLSSGGKATLYRAVRTADHRSVVLKVLDPHRSHPKDVERLKHEYEIETGFETSAALKPLGLETYEGMPALVLEDFGGRSLDRMLAGPMPIASFLPLALAITKAVADVHERGVVHRDLKPENILVNPSSGEVKIADFGIASRVPREQPTPRPASLIEGSPPYLSPEQTGRTNRAVDSRSDLYSLGITFYRMLTGRLPFEARDAVEWVHCHVARVPRLASELVPEIPEAIARIVAKLLSKMPEDRYQSARGLYHDWERCLEEWSLGGTVQTFTLATRDVPDRLQLPQRLYGRDAELGLLLDAFKRVVTTGNAELLLVSGYSGIGKSVLVRELYRPVSREHAFFLSGKFDRYKRDIPYATLVQAFRELVLEILAQSEEQVAIWKKRILDALGPNAQLIVDVIPQIGLIIGPQTAPPELPPAEAQNRFRIAFRHFIAVFAHPEHPLVLFLDDLQWADPASLVMLEELVTSQEVRHLLAISAYRDNEVTPSHPSMLAIDDVRRAGARISNIVLGAISPAHLAMFVGDALRCPLADAASLAELVYEKTGGVPFFAIQFLTNLYEERLLVFDARAEAFRWDIEKIRAKNYTDNVVDLIVGKLRRLPAVTQDALTYLACLGSAAESRLLMLVRGGKPEELHADFWAAVVAGLVIREGDTYKFLHDRVQEAAYTLVPEADCARMHLRLGRLLVSRMPAEAVSEHVFEILNQWNRSLALVSGRDEREMLSRLEAIAGTRAKASIAYASARGYLRIAASLLPENAWSTRYPEALAIHLDLSECEYLVGEYAKADELFDEILRNARSVLDKVKVHRLRIRCYQLAGRHNEALAVVIAALRLLGVTIPETPEGILAATMAEIQKVVHGFRGRRASDLAEVPMNPDPKLGALVDVLDDGVAPAYMTRSPLWSLIIAKRANLAWEQGVCAGAPLGFVFYAIVLVALVGDARLAFEVGEMAVALNDRVGGAKAVFKGRSLFLHAAMINFWRRPFSTSLGTLDKAFASLLEVGDLLFAGFVMHNKFFFLLESGEPLDALVQQARSCAAFAKQSHNDLVYLLLRIEEHFALELKGARSAGDTFDEAGAVASLEAGGDGVALAFHHVLKQVSAFIEGRYRDALGCATAARREVRYVKSLVAEPAHHFYLGLTAAALYADAPAEEKEELARTLEEEWRRHEVWAEDCPENFQNRRALLSAELARIEERDVDAMHLYQEAIRWAADTGLVHQEALAWEVASRFYRARGFEQIADAYVREARACYARWGAEAKVRALDRRHPQAAARGLRDLAATLVMRAEQLDLLAVTKACQVVSGEIVLDELVHTLLKVVVELGGARRACLVLSEAGSLCVAAEATLGDKGIVTSVPEPVPGEEPRCIPSSVVHYVLRTGEDVVLGDGAGMSRFSADPYFARRAARSILCVPIKRQAAVVGLLYLENDLLVGAFTPERLAALQILATQAAVSLQNARLLAKERAARESAEAAERRKAFVSEAGALLAESLDYAQTFVRLGELCVRALADYCMIDILEAGELKRLAVAHSERMKASLLDELQRRYPVRGRRAPQVAMTVLRTGAPLVVPELTDEILRPLCEDAGQMRLFRALGTQALISVPLVARGQTLGVLTLVSAAPGRRYGDADLATAQEVARRAAIAIDNARLYRDSQDALRARNEFLHVASHELHTPVTSLMLAVDIIRHAAPAARLDPKTMGRLLDRVSQQGERLTRLSHELLDVTRLESGRFPLDLEDVDLGALARDVLERFEVDIAQSKCVATLSVDTPEGKPIVGRWDRSRIDQVITNLLSNAIKFGPGAPIEITVSMREGAAQLSVRDYGIGIPANQVDRIFGPFERAVSARNYAGLGLGLFISRKIVERHRGSIRCETTVDRGATFTVTLPLVSVP